MYWEFSVCKNLLYGFLVIEIFVVFVICAGKVCIICCLCNLLCCIKPHNYVWEFSVCRVVYNCCIDINVSINVSLSCNLLDEYVYK